MVLGNAHYKVTIRRECRPDLKAYRVLYQPEDLDLSEFYYAYLIEVDRIHRPSYSLALLDLLISNTEPFAVLEENILTVILFRTILRLDLDSETVVQCVDCENMGGLEEIHPIPGGYILKGEGDIFRYDKNLNQRWRRAGRDIFATPEGSDCFWLEGDKIHCLDWEGWHYVFNMDGTTIREFAEKQEKIE